MSERTAIRMARVATVVVGAAAWCAGAWSLSRTIVPPLHLSGLDQHRYFDERLIRRAARFSRGEDGIWLLATVAKLVALAVLVRVLPRSVRGIGLGRVASAVIVGM